MMRFAFGFARRGFSTRSVLVNGGDGALGRAVVTSFKNRGWNTTSVDFKKNLEADINMVLDSGKSWQNNVNTVMQKLKEQDNTFNVIVNAAGGWAGGSAKDTETIANVDSMIAVNLHSAVTASHIACRHLKDGGLLVLTGAAPVFEGGTGGMISYGVAKAGVHHIVKSLSNEDSGLPQDASVVCILPETIDTPANRTAMPTADYDGWTRPSVIGNCLLKWAENSTDNVPPLKNGGFYTFKTFKKGVSVADFCNDVEVSYRHLSN